MGRGGGGGWGVERGEASRGSGARPITFADLGINSDNIFACHHSTVLISSLLHCGFWRDGFWLDKVFFVMFFFCMIFISAMPYWIGAICAMSCFVII